MNRIVLWVGLVLTLGQTAFVLLGSDFSGTIGFFPLLFTVDRLSQVLLLSIGLVTFAALVVGYGTIVDENRRFNFFNLMFLAMIGMNGVVMVSDFFSLYVYLEITAVSCYILISFNKDSRGLEGAFKYLILSAVASVMMLLAIGVFMVSAGGITFPAVAEALKGYEGFLPILAIVLFLGGLFIKGGLVPFHGWLPDAYSSAPSAATILLAGIVTKTTGVYTLIRIVSQVFGFSGVVQTTLLVIGAITILVGALACLGQRDFKRMLAYSSISQVGYIILSLGTGTELGLAGAVFHLFNHSIFKSLLFVNAAAVEQQTGTRDMSTMGGLSNRMPITGWTSVVAFLSTAGIPPLSGFWSKLVIVIALWQSGHYNYAALAIVASVITLAYFLVMQRKVFFGNVGEGMEGIKEAGMSLIIPSIILAVITIGVGVFFPFLISTIILPIGKIL